MKIRDAAEEDLPAIVEFYSSAVPGRGAWLYEHDPEAAGWFSFEPGRKKPAYNATAEVRHLEASGARSIFLICAGERNAEGWHLNDAAWTAPERYGDAATRADGQVVCRAPKRNLRVRRRRRS